MASHNHYFVREVQNLHLQQEILGTVSSTFLALVMQNTVKCYYNSYQYNMIFHIPMQWLRQTINQSLNPQKTYLAQMNEVHSVRIWKEIDHSISKLDRHCTVMWSEFPLVFMIDLLSSKYDAIIKIIPISSDKRQATILKENYPLKQMLIDENSFLLSTSMFLPPYIWKKNPVN